MIELREGVHSLVLQEKARADQNHGECYNSPHEGWAVMLEEMLEAKDEARRVEEMVKELWHSVRMAPLPPHTQFMYEKAANICVIAQSAAAEFIQVAAVCARFLHSVNCGGREWNMQEAITHEKE